MTKLVIVGQAPAKSGDGRPFSGPSGRRLYQLFNLEHYDALASRATLVSLLDRPVDVGSPSRGAAFDHQAANRRARQLMVEWAKDPELVVVLACGKEVFTSLTGTQRPFFRGKKGKLGPVQFVDLWCFPHPSGASSFWRDPQNIRQAQNFLKRLLYLYGIDIA